MGNKKIKILALSLFGRQGASSRYRLYQYIPHLEKKGIECKVFPLINDKSYNILLDLKKVNIYFKPILKLKIVMVALVKRFFHILQAGKYDMVFIQKDVLPSPYLYLLKIIKEHR